MANSIEVILSAKDATGGAFASAQQRMQKYAGSTQGAGNSFRESTREMRHFGMAANEIGSLLKGDVSALDNMGRSLAMINPQLLKFGMGLAAVGVAAQIGKELNNAFAISTRIKALIEGVDPSQVRTFGEKIEKEIKDADAAVKRIRDVRSAKNAAMNAEIGAGNVPERNVTDRIEKASQHVEEKRAELAEVNKGVTGEVTADQAKKIDAARQALEQAESEAALAKDISGLHAAGGETPHAKRLVEAKATAQQELETIQDNITDAERKAEQKRSLLTAAHKDAGHVPGVEGLKKIREAEDEVDRADADLAATREAGAYKAAAAQNKLREALNATRKDLADMTKQADMDKLAGKIEGATESIRGFQGYIDRISAGLAAMKDTRLTAEEKPGVPKNNAEREALIDPRIGARGKKSLAIEAIGGGDAEAKKLLEKQDQLRGIDEMTAMRKAEHDPSVKAQQRQLEKERRRTEHEIEHIKQRAEDHRPLNKRELDVLKESRGVEERIRQERAKRAAEEQLRLDQAQQTANNTARTANAAELILKDHVALLTAL